MFGYGHDWGMMGGGFGWMQEDLTWCSGCWHSRCSLAACFGSCVPRHQSAWGAMRPRRPRAVSIVLEQRYARGEVNREEYLQKKGDLQA